MLVGKILKSAKRLEDMPESGRIVPEADKRHIRELIVGKYRIIYRTAENRVDELYSSEKFSKKKANRALEVWTR